MSQGPPISPPPPIWTFLPGPGSMLTFNVNDGYMEGILRGYRSGILGMVDYTNLTQCENLEGK
jgi:hypothetical protein